MNEDKRNRKINLEHLKKENVFQVPDQYFETLPELINEKVKKNNSQSGTKVIRMTFRYALPVAAMVVVAIYLGIFSQSTDESLEVEDMIANITVEELYDYLENSEISTDEIIASLDNEELDLDFNDGSINLIDDLDLTDENMEMIIDEFDLDSLIN